MRKQFHALFKCRLNQLLILSIIFISVVEASERPHQHGIGELSIAVEGQDVEIELIVPGSDVVGFEHSPSSKSEREAVVKGTKTLEDANSIIGLSPEAKCQLEDVEVASELMEDKKGGYANNNRQKHDDHKHKHAVKAKGDHDDHHKHQSKDHDAHIEVHSEFITKYQFHCDNPDKLAGFTLGFFTAFPSAHELQLKWITPKGQGARELSAKSTSVTFY